MKIIKKISFLIVLILATACGVATAPPQEASRNENTVINDSGNQQLSGFTIVTRTVQTVGSYYYSFQGRLHAACADQGIQPHCVVKQVQKDCTPNIYNCFPGSTYTASEEINYVNRCSWEQAGETTAKYTSRPCSY